MSRSLLPSLFPLPHVVDLSGGVAFVSRFDVDLRCVCQVALHRRKDVLCVAEAVYQKRKERAYRQPRHKHGFRYLGAGGGSFDEPAALRRIDDLYAQVARLTALSEKGILAL